MASSSLPPQQEDAFSGASSSDRPAFSGIEPPHEKRRVSESSRLYDVFINHRGPDVKDTLALELYKSLEKVNIKAFLDSKEKELGVSFTSTIETAIRSAAVHIAIFSKGYAKSSWCLEELVLMLRSKAKIIPIFYDVEPSALRYVEKGVYGSAFSEYEKKKRYMKKLEEWKKALQEISFIAGEKLHYKSFSDCESIISTVQKEVQRMRPLVVAKYPVGLARLVKQFQNQCINEVVQDFESQYGMDKQVQGKSKIVGIFGMGGVGKTTLSKELFNRRRSDYNRSCFLFDVREASASSNLPSLQFKLLRELFDVKDPESVTTIDDGKCRLTSHIQRSGKLSFLIVVDDIDHLDQLDALLVSDTPDKFLNSLVIVTTRDEGVLKSAGITVRYHLRGLDKDNAKELFCWHAFGRACPSSGWEKLVDNFVKVCGGLPLSLQVLGSHVRGEDRMFWQLELEKVEKILPEDILKRLRISVDTLDGEEKQIFMDVACFFIGEMTAGALSVWEASGWSSQHALQILKNKCLVEEIESDKSRGRVDSFYYDKYRGAVDSFYYDSVDDSYLFSEDSATVLRMHDHLRDLGRQMAAEKLSDPRRLWGSQVHLQSLELKAFEKILTQPRVRCLLSFGTSDTSIKFFVGESENTAGTSTVLLWHEMRGYGDTLTIIPPWIPLQNLHSLRIDGGSLKRYWDNDKQAPFHLKELQILDDSELENLSFSFLTRVQKITIRNCRNLSGVAAISDVPVLAELNIGSCWKLEELFRSDCSDLKSLRGMSGLEKLVKLRVEQCPKLKEISFFQLNSLEKIRISGCRYLKSMVGMSSLEKLVELEVEQCPQLEEISFVQLSYLESIKLSHCQMLRTLKGISGLTKLVVLNISECEELEEFSLIECPHLKSVNGIDFLKELAQTQKQIEECKKLEELSPARLCPLQKVTFSGHDQQNMVVSHLRNLVKLDFIDCGYIKKLSLDPLRYLEAIIFPDCTKVESIEVIDCKSLCRVNLQKSPYVVTLTICECPELENLSELVNLRLLRMVSLYKCPKLKKISLPTTLIKLTLHCCSELQTVEGLNDGTDVEELFISNCPDLESDELSLDQLSRLKTIAIVGCGKIQKITGIEKLHSLERVRLLYRNNETVRNCILNMEKLPSDFIQVIGRADDGVESDLKASFFSEEDVSANSVIQIGVDHNCPDDEVSAIILCAVVVVKTSTAANEINDFMRPGDQNAWLKFEVRQGEWLIASVITNPDELHRYILDRGYYFPFDYVFTDQAVTEDVMVRKGYRVTLRRKEGEEHKALNLLRRIVDKLY